MEWRGFSNVSMMTKVMLLSILFLEGHASQLGCVHFVFLVKLEFQC
jgi:hypothetical protein